MTQALELAIVLAHFGTGGVERVACILANELGASGMRVGFAVSSADGPVRGIVSSDVRVTELVGPTWVSRWRALKLIRAIPALARFIRAERPRVLLSPGNHTHVVVAIAHRLARTPETKLVVKITNPILKAGASPLNEALRRAFYRFMFARVAVILVLSPGGVAQVADIDPEAAKKARFVHNPYVTLRPETIPVDSPPSTEPPLVLSTGRLTAQKNYALLLRAMAKLVDRPWRLVILGEGPLREALEAEAKALGIADRVAFPGFVTDPAPYYREARTFVLSSIFEDLPAVLLEAMSHGCDVIATRCSPAVVDIMTEAGATLVPIEDAALAHAIASSLGREGGRVVPEAVAKYSIDNGVREHARAFAACLEAGPVA